MTELTTTAGDIQAAIDAGVAIADPKPLSGDARFYTVVTPADGDLKVIDLEEHLERYRDAPRRKTGTVIVHDAASFTTYVGKHGLPESEIFADIEARRIAGVINAHGGTIGGDADQDDDTENSNGTGPVGSVIEDQAGFCDHRVVLILQLTPEWKSWIAKDRQPMTQVSFAEHIEDHLTYILEPPSAEMLEISQSLSVKRDVTFESSNQLRSGERNLVYRENDDAKAGRQGNLTIPETFIVGLRPFEGGPLYQIQARLRYRIEDGHLRLSYVLDRPDEVLRNAFLDIRTEIAEATGRPVLAGRFDG